MATQAVSPSSAQAAVRHSWLPMIVIAMGQALMSFNVSAIPVSMSGMIASFHTPPTTVGTAIVMYSLGVSGFVMLGAKLGQRFGSKTFFQAAVALLGAAMVLMVVSPNATVMLAASVPALLESEFGRVLETTLLAVRWFPDRIIDPYAGMGFSLRTSETFEVRGRKPGGVLLARKEAPDELSPAEPILLIYSATSAAVAPLAVLARQQLTENPQFTGFANFGSIGILLGGIGGLAPTRRGDLARLGGRALLAGFIATMINAAIAAMLI